MKDVKKLDAEIAELQAKRNSILEAEKQSLLNRVAQIESILSGKVKIASPKTRKVEKSKVKHSSAFGRGVVKSAIVNALTEAGKPMSVAEIFTKVSTQPTLAKLTQDGLRNNVYALANSSAKTLVKTGRGQFTLPTRAVAPPTVQTQAA